MRSAAEIASFGRAPPGCCTNEVLAVSVYTSGSDKRA